MSQIAEQAHMETTTAGARDVQTKQFSRRMLYRNIRHTLECAPESFGPCGSARDRLCLMHSLGSFPQQVMQSQALSRVYRRVPDHKAWCHEGEPAV